MDVRASIARDAGRDDVRLDVSPVDHQRAVPTEALGSIAFFDDMPDAAIEAIEMYPNAIATLASTAIQVGYAESEHSTVVRDRLVGRVMGRALAHEIGHFLLRSLLRSQQHSATGLMRAHPSVSDLLARDRRAFVPSPEEVTRLVSVISFTVQRSSQQARRHFLQTRVSNRSSARPCCPQQPSSYVFACKAKNLGSDIASTRESSFVPHRSLVPMKDSIRIHRG
jgi:hypothetical protein